MFSVRHDNILNFILRTWKQVGCVFPCILLKEDIGVALWELRTPRLRCGLSMGGHCEEEKLIPSPSPVYAFGSFLRLKKKKKKKVCLSPMTSAAPPQLHAFIFSLHSSWKSLLSLSVAGPYVQQLNYPQDLRVPNYSADNGPEQLHRYCLFQKGHMSFFM